MYGIIKETMASHNGIHPERTWHFILCSFVHDVDDRDSTWFLGKGSIVIFSCLLLHWIQSLSFSSTGYHPQRPSQSCYLSNNWWKKKWIYLCFFKRPKCKNEPSMNEMCDMNEKWNGRDVKGITIKGIDIALWLEEVKTVMFSEVICANSSIKLEFERPTNIHFPH